MAQKTTNYELHKIDLSDAPPDITVLNQNWDKIDEELADRLPLSGGALTGSLTVMDNFNVNKTYDTTEYKTYVRPINYSIGSNGEYSAGMLLYNGETNNSQLMFNKDGVMFRDNVAGKAYHLYGQHNTSIVASNIRSQLYTYGTSDMTAGQTALETGKIYLMYE